MTLVKKIIGFGESEESGSLPLTAETIRAFSEEFAAGKRVLVLTATGAALLKNRKSVRQFFGQPHVAFKLAGEIISGNYNNDRASGPSEPLRPPSGIPATG